MYCNFEGVREERTKNGYNHTLTDGETVLPPALRGTLNPLHYRVLELHCQGRTISQVAKGAGLTIPSVRQILRRPEIQERIHQWEQAIEAKISSGEYGVSAIAKANAAAAMTTIVAISESSADLRTKLAACKDVLKFAGAEPPTKIQVGFDHLLDQMTPDELDHYCETQEWPDRFLPHLGRLAKVVEDKRVEEAKAVRDIQDAVVVEETG